MEWLGLLILGLSLLSSPLSGEGLCPGGMLAVHTAHEWGHALGALAEGSDSVSPLALAGDKWTDTQRTAPRAGLVGQTVLAGVMGDPCTVHSNLIYHTVYVARTAFDGRALEGARLGRRALGGPQSVAGFERDRVGDYGVFKNRSVAGLSAMLTAVTLEGIAAGRRPAWRLEP